MVVHWLGYGLAAVALLLLAGAAYTGIEVWRIERRFPPAGSFVTVTGRAIHFIDLPADDPDQPTLVFIHGASGNLRDPMLAFRAALAGRYRLVFIDRPGHGYSERGSGPGISAPLEQARVIREVMRARGIDRAIIVGHSWGGAVAAALAVDAPEVVAGLMLLAPATHPWPGGIEWYYSVATTPVIGPLFARTILVPAAESMVQGSLKEVFAPSPEPPSYLAAAAIPLVFRPAEFLANAEDVANLKVQVTAMAPRYRQITAPTVIIAGAGDTVVRNDLHAEALAREIAGARLITLPQAGGDGLAGQ